MSRFTACVVLVALVGSVHAVGPDFFVTNPSSCMASTKSPTKPRPLEFCYWLNADSCCTPGNDALAKEKFFDFVDNGPGCSPSDHHIRATYREIRDFICLGCDPREPQYRFLAINGDAHLPGGANQPDPAAAPTEFVWRVCASFLYGPDGRSGLWGGDGGKYDKCGVNLRTPCSAHTLVGYDSVNQQFVDSGKGVLPADLFCGDDTVIPSSEYGMSAPNQRAAAREFLSVLPQWLPDFRFVITNDSAPDFNYNATPCFRYSSAVSFSPLIAVLGTVMMLLLA